ncbi:Eukaryotic translation initiation factor 4G [Quillaja saponaria]|uniref:Eukaryotic translation initiation factor 4G n=1 Tax=Quillaja saponaria TaxID=32244 RepID=A0AAD7L4Y4_QUISA|nr:Eukaryotic translation initiation factor 4G [Quillaja saponaria]
MSFQQSRSDKSDIQYRKSGRLISNQQRGSSGSYVKGGGGGGPAPSPSITSSSSLSSNRSLKKSNNVQGGQSRVNPATVSSAESNNASTARTLQNGSHVQPQLHGVSDAISTSSVAKPAETSVAQRSTRAVPKAPTSQHAPLGSAAPTTPAKATGDASKAFPFQFGSISPGFMNGMAIPARTSSAPPNLDEQKRDQARHDSFGSVPSLPTAPVPKQQPPRKDAGNVGQSSTVESRLVPKAKMDAQVSPSPSSSQMPKSSAVPMTGISMTMPFHHSQTSVQFSGPNLHIQSQGMSSSSLQIPMPMPLPMGNPPQVQHQVFVPGLQPHPMHPQGIIPGQNMSFTAQMGPQMAQLGKNIGLGITPQYAQQQGGNFGGPPRKTTVKITHPDTHEELRLDKRADTYSDGGISGPRSHPNMPSQSQPIPSFAASHNVNYYQPNSYNAGSLFYPSSSVPLTSSQITSTSQPRFNYPVNHPQTVAFMNPSLNSLPVNKTGTPIHNIVEVPKLEHSREVHNVVSSTPSGATPVTVKPSGGSGVVVTSISNCNSSTGIENNESPTPSKASGEASSSIPQKNSETCSEITLQQSKSGTDSSKLPPKQSTAVYIENVTFNPSLPASAVLAEESLSIMSNNEGRRKEPLMRSNSIKDHQKKPGKRSQSQQQVGGESLTVSSLPSPAVEISFSVDIRGSEPLETTEDIPTTITSENMSSTAEMPSTIDESVPNAVKPKVDISEEGYASFTSDVSGSGFVTGTADSHHDSIQKLSQPCVLLKQDSMEKVENHERKLPEGSRGDIKNCGLYSESISLNLTEQDSVQNLATINDDVQTLNTVNKGVDEPKIGELVRKCDGVGMFTSTMSDSGDVASLSRKDSITSNEAVSESSGTSDQQFSSVLTNDLPAATSKHDGDCAGNSGGGFLSLPVSGPNDRPVLEPNKAKAASKGKKKRKEVLQKADAAGTTSDLYNAYKGPEEKDTAAFSESTEIASVTEILKQEPTDSAETDAIAREKGGQTKVEPDDWEDAADMLTPKLEVADSDAGGNLAKKYSRDFLLKFADQCVDLPKNFEIAADIAEAVMTANVNSSHLVERDSYPSPGRIIDRPSVGPRLDRRGSGLGDDEKWSKFPGSGRDIRLDASFGGHQGFRPGQGGNFGVLRNPRAQAPLQYGILSGPLQSMGPQGGMQRHSPDAERWQRATNFQKGLIPSPHTPLQMMHKAEKKYEVGKVTDEEQAKQRQLKAILNKLTPQNFEKLFEQVKEVNIDNAVTLSGVITQIFDKALMEPTFCEMYANFCFHLAGELPDFSEDNEKITFKRLLLNKCQEEFERGEREQEEANKAEDEGEVKQSEGEREEKRIKARRRMLGNIRLIGELYKKRMLTVGIMHECIKKLLGQYQDPDEEDIEALCKLMSTIGEMIDHPKAKEHMDAYFERMKMLSNNMNLSSRVRFMLKDAIDLRKNKWQQRRKVEGPKKIEEIHRDAAQERQGQASRLGRGPGISPSTRRMPMDFGPRGSTILSSPNAQMGSFRGTPTQVRGYSAKDARLDDRQSYEARNLSVTLPQRPAADGSITLGPQGGLARGMSGRGPPAVSSAPVSDIPPGPGDSRRMTAVLNGYGNLPERAPYGSREYIQDRFSGPTAYDQSSVQDRNMNYGNSNRELRNPDRSFNRSLATSPPARVQLPAVSQNVPSEKIWPEERLRDMSLSAIKEFYSARDEKEVALCVKDLNSPSFHPSMVSLWVTDSFERKDLERDLLAKLLINLTKSQDGTLSRAQLIKGFESVLTTLEDAVNDAPRAPEFLGRIFAKAIVENVVPFNNIGRLLYEGGEEPGRLLEVGLAADVLGCTLEIIKLEKGDTVLSEICKSSNVRLEDFRPPDLTSRKLEKFI